MEKGPRNYQQWSNNDKSFKNDENDLKIIKNSLKRSIMVNAQNWWKGSKNNQSIPNMIKIDQIMPKIIKMSKKKCQKTQKWSKSPKMEKGPKNTQKWSNNNVENNPKMRKKSLECWKSF